VLRGSDGKEMRVRMKRLSEQDRAFVRAQQRNPDKRQPQGKPKVDSKVASEAIEEAAFEFFRGLRGSERAAARQTLTKRAQELTDTPQSPLTKLPQPALGKKAIVAGRAKLDGNVAEIPVRVRASGQLHKTKLHLRYENERWAVFAISATYPEGEKSINFEAEGAMQAKAEPLEILLGKPMELAGYTVDGVPLDTAAFTGKVVLIDFWATWCGPCRAEIPNILRNWQAYHDDGFDVIAISVDRDLNALEKFVAVQQPPWTVVADNHPRNREKMGAKYGIRGIPAFVLIGRDGNVAAVNCRGQRLGQHLARLVGNGR
jgi:thiol-disulfide isomerase/thioredoxin